MVREISGRGVAYSELNPSKFVQAVPSDEGYFPVVLWADLNLVTVEGVYNVYYGAPCLTVEGVYIVYYGAPVSDS